MKDYFARTEKFYFFAIIFAFAFMVYGDGNLWGATHRSKAAFAEIGEAFYEECLTNTPKELCDINKARTNDRAIQKEILRNMERVPKELQGQEVNKLLYLKTYFQNFSKSEEYKILCEHGLKEHDQFNEEGISACECVGKGLEEILSYDDYVQFSFEKIRQQLSDDLNKAVEACRVKMEKK